MKSMPCIFSLRFHASMGMHRSSLRCKSQIGDLGFFESQQSPSVRRATSARARYSTPCDKTFFHGLGCEALDSRLESFERVNLCYWPTFTACGPSVLGAEPCARHTGCLYTRSGWYSPVPAHRGRGTTHLNNSGSPPNRHSTSHHDVFQSGRALHYVP